MGALRVAVVGYGHMGRLHAARLLARGAGGEPPATPPGAGGALVGAGSDGVEVVVHDPAAGLHADLGAIDAAIVATPTRTHAEVAGPLLSRGVPCLVEKPLAATVAEARALADHPHLAVGHIERFNPTLDSLAGVDPRFVQAERVGRWTPRGTDVDVIHDLMIHDLDLFLALTGEEVVEVRANGASVATGGVDLAHARVETASGRVGTFTASRLARQPARRWRVLGRAGYLHLDLKERAAVRVAWDGGELAEERLPVPARDPLGEQLAAFLAAVRGERPYAVTGADGLRALVLAARIRDAIRDAP